jgi:hypothetical protein
MKLSLCLVLLAAARQATSQYTIKYWAGSGCSPNGLQCANIPAFDCCDAPPGGGSVFHSIRVTSSGAPGVVIFTFPTAGGGCGGCQFTGSINTCYNNDNPFNTAYVVNPFSVCSAATIAEREVLANLTMADKIPISNAAASAPSECRASHQPDEAISDGHIYDITGPHRDAIISDLLELPAEEFATKWASAYKWPAPAEEEASTIESAKE